MKIALLITSFLAFSACAQTPKVEISTLTIRPGEVRFVEFPVVGETARLFCREQEVKLYKKDNKAQAFIIESYFSDLKPFSCRIQTDDEVSHEIRVVVEDKEYKAEQLKVDSKRIRLSPANQRRADREQIVLNKIYNSSVPQFLFTHPFEVPLKTFITSVYGTKRVYNKRKKGQHLGTDFRAAIGDKVPAANSGKVVFADDLFYTGHTVIIDHGMDIFTVYGHLSKPLVKAGDMVKRGDLIGLSGNTGRTSGPHLHWGVKVQGQYIDGMVMIDETKKYFRD